MKDNNKKNSEKKPLTVRIAPQVYNDLDKIAKQRKTSKGEMVENALIRYLQIFK